MKQKRLIMTLCMALMVVIAGHAQQNYFGESFKTISLYNVQGSTVNLEKKLNLSNYRVNGDGNKFYQTTLAVSITSKGKTERNVIDTDIYTERNYSKGSLPCMLIDPKKEVLYIFANSKASDRYYGMDGIAYRLDMNTKRWTREIIFSSANYGWFSFFGGSNNGNPELWHFSYAGYYQMKSVRSSNGSWSTYNMGSIRPEQADAQYQYHENILVTSASGVDRMSANYSKRNTSSSLVPGISNKTLAVGAAVVGTGAILYGLFKLLGSAASGSSSSSSYSSSYSSGSSYSSSSSSSSSSYSNSSNSKDVDPETVDVPAWEIYQREDIGKTLLNGKGKRYKIHFGSGYNTTGYLEVYDESPGKVFVPSVNEYYNSMDNAAKALYVMKKYGKKRRTGLK